MSVRAGGSRLPLGPRPTGAVFQLPPAAGLFPLSLVEDRPNFKGGK